MTDLLVYCEICQCYQSEMRELACRHRFCENCLMGYLDFKILSSSVLSISCPASCGYVFSRDELFVLLPPEKFSAYLSALSSAQINVDPNSRMCPFSNCEGHGKRPGVKQRVSCNECEREFCFYCLQEWKDGHFCPVFLDYTFEKWTRRRGVKYCPNCKRKVEKSGGCPEMHCPMCQYRWCWYCGKDKDSGHDSMECVLMVGSWNFRLWFIFFIIAGPLTIWFSVGLVIIYILHIFGEDIGDNRLTRGFLKFKWVISPVVLVLSPLLLILCTAASGYVLIAMSLSGSRHRRIHSCLCIFATLGLVLVFGTAISFGVCAGLIIILLLSPVIGCVLLVCKIVLFIRRIKIKHRVYNGYYKLITV